MEIVKFGGFSMATPETIKQCRNIIFNNKEQHAIVVSAPGKYGEYQTKVTDDLIDYTKGISTLSVNLIKGATSPLFILLVSISFLE